MSNLSFNEVVFKKVRIEVLALDVRIKNIDNVLIIDLHWTIVRSYWVSFVTRILENGKVNRNVQGIFDVKEAGNYTWNLNDIYNTPLVPLNGLGDIDIKQDQDVYFTVI